MPIRCPLPAHQQIELAQRYRDGETIPMLSRAYGIYVSTTQRILKRHHVAMRSRSISPAEAREVAERYKSGWTIRRISEQYGRHRTTILIAVREAGFRVRLPWEAIRRHTIDETVFDCVTEQSAYWIGFLMADGCVHWNSPRSASIILSLTASDRSHVEKFRTFLKSDHPISLCDRRSSFSGQPVVRLCVSSAKNRHCAESVRRRPEQVLHGQGHWVGGRSALLARPGRWRWFCFHSH